MSEKVKTSLLQQVANELNESARKEVKNKLKELLVDRQKATTALDAIDDKIVELLAPISDETEEEIRASITG